MKNKLIIRMPLLIAAAIMLAGCATSRKVSYLLDMDYGESIPARTSPELRLQKEDMLNIRVYCDEVELTKPFTLASSDGSFMSYQIDSVGVIDFPVIGDVKAEGKTIKGLESELTERIAASGYIKNPVVKVELENFTITVLGAVGNKNLTVEGGSLDMLQLLAMTGSPGLDCDFKDVMVIRTENGMRTPYKVNLQSKSIYDSPVFYLQQNDVVYFKPKGLKMTPTGDTIIKVISPGWSLASFISNILLWINR